MDTFSSRYEMMRKTKNKQKKNNLPDLSLYKRVQSVPGTNNEECIQELNFFYINGTYTRK